MNYIYIHTNKENGKVYIGQTNQDPEKRWGKEGERYKGCKRFYSAIKKYGWDGFEHEILISGVDDSTVNFWETYFINHYDSMNRDKGYNLRSGGKKCFKVSNEVKQKISSSLKGKMSGENNPMFGKTHSEEVKQKISLENKVKLKGENNPMFGKKLSDEHKQKISLAEKGKKKKPMSEEQKQKLSLANKGKKLTDEQKQKISSSLKGRIVSEETRQKLSLANKGKMSEEQKKRFSQVNKGKHWKLVDGKRIYY